MKGNQAQIPNDQNPYPRVQNAICTKSLINHRLKDIQYEYIGDEERIQDEYINDEREEMTNIELLMGCTRND